MARTVVLSLVMSAVGVALSLHALSFPAPAAPVAIPWWALLLLVMGTDAFVFHLELRGEAHTFTLSEIPVVIGFFFAPAPVVIVCRIVGSTVFQALRRRQFGVKLLFNAADFVLDAGLIVTLLHVLVGARRPQEVVTWVLVVCCAITTELPVSACLSTVIRWHGGHSRVALVVATTVVVSVVNTSLGILAADLLWTSPSAIALLAVVLGITFTAYRGYFNLHKRYSSLQLLYDFTKTVGGSMRAEAVLQEILSQARQLLAAERAEVILFEGTTGHATLRQTITEDDAPAEAGLLDPAAGGDLSVLWEQIKDGTGSVVVPRGTRDPGLIAVRQASSVDDLIVAPLRAEGHVVGAILVANRLGQVSTFDEEDARLFETLANHASVAFDNSRLVQQLRQEADERRHEAEERRHEALHDSLTGLPNRTLFNQQVGEVLGGRGEAAVLLMDLDRFKEVNDSLGHHHGDLLLIEVANRLLETLGREDSAARLGGDEFAILLGGTNDAVGVEASARRILDAFERSFRIGEVSLDVGASIGIALAPSDGSDPATLLQRADVAMYEAKTAKTGLARYSAERDRFTPRRLALAGRLRQAIDDREIIVHFQPKARLADGKVMAAEALVRWRHPEFGMVMPDEFIPIAEQAGLEPHLTRYVLRAALRHCADWQRAGHRIGVAVNLAVRSLLDARLPDAVTSMLAESGVPVELLTLEITESSVMADPDRATAVLNRLAGLGLRLSVDDFGTGYSSLSYLQRLPVHEVKVDKSFVFRMASDANDATIVESIVQLGHKLGLSVVAEGVEDQLSWDRLRAMSCDVAQGYYVSKPIPAATMSDWLDEQRRLDGAA
ncbi:MAG TPA: EAL domain-containing protein [Acidimicrobiales bacterium]|jgi:diguanylate cyclase (GGDEF)-like protein|nr:EAL domain-containing protein [Acidimicrobiales bacterium]